MQREETDLDLTGMVVIRQACWLAKGMGI